MNHVLIYAIFRTEAWWSHVGRNMGFDRVTVISDMRSRGDRWVTDGFYAAFKRFRSSRKTSSALLTEAQVADVVARCRVLRWLPKDKATAMVLAMAQAMDEALIQLRPDAIVSLPIDSYVIDVLERRARARGIPYFEVTISSLPGASMLLYRGALMTSEQEPDPEVVEARVAEIADPEFAPVYVQNAKTFTRLKFHRVQAYFQLRGLVFKLYSWAIRDPLNLRCLDAQPGLGHKADSSDARIVDMVEHDWAAKLQTFEKNRRVLFGLQVFPEAAIDYWIDDLRMIDQQAVLLELARGLSAAGFQIVVKDHPLQFGFRQTALLQKLKTIPNVVIVPYSVTGNAMLAQCGVSVTATGTLGLQAALLGNASITSQAYYVVPEDFLVVTRWDDLASIPERLMSMEPPTSLNDRQVRIVSHVLKGSFDGNFMSLFGFDPRQPNPEVDQMGRELGKQLRRMGPQGEDWHRRNLSHQRGGHDGSPLSPPWPSTEPEAQ